MAIVKPTEDTSPTGERCYYHYTEKTGLVEVPTNSVELETGNKNRNEVIPTKLQKQHAHIHHNRTIKIWRLLPLETIILFLTLFASAIILLLFIRCSARQASKIIEILCWMFYSVATNSLSKRKTIATYYPLVIFTVLNKEPCRWKSIVRRLGGNFSEQF